MMRGVLGACAVASAIRDGATWATPQVTPYVAPQVSPQVIGLLRHLSGKGEMTRQELMDIAGLKDRKHFAKAYLQPALDGELLEMTIPDKPQSSKQRYRLTAAGHTAAERPKT